MVRRKLWVLKANGVRQRISTTRAGLKKRGYAYNRRKRTWVKPPVTKRRRIRIKKRTFRVKRAKVPKRKKHRKMRRGIKKLKRLRKRKVKEQRKRKRLVKRKKRLEAKVEKIKVRRVKKVERIGEKETRRAQKERLREDIKALDREPRTFDHERALVRQSIAINYVNHSTKANPRYYSIIIQVWDKSEDKLRRLETAHKRELIRALERHLGVAESDWWFVYQFGVGYQAVPYDKFLDGRKEIRNERRGG